MRQRFHRPFIIAAFLALCAVLLLWLRVPHQGEAAPAKEPTPPRPLNGETTRPAPGSSAPATPRDTPVTPDEGAFLVRVTGPQGPLAGAKVRAFRRPPDERREPTWRLTSEGTTGPDGTVQLPARPGDYLVTAQAPGHAPARREATRPEDLPQTVVELTLTEGVTLRGRTVEEGGGEPVPLAEVTLHPYPGTAFSWAQPVELAEEAATATSDGRGQFELSGLAPGRYRLTAQAPGFSRRELLFLHVPQQGQLVVGLWGAGTLEGYVVDAKGQPAPGARVRASGGLTPLETISSEGGGFALEVGMGNWVLTAQRGDAVGRAPGTLFVGPGQTLRGLTLTLGAEGGLTGEVRSTDVAFPVRSAELVVHPADSQGELARTTLGGGGIYRLGLPPGSYDVVVQSPGFSRGMKANVEVGAGVFTQLDFELEPASASLQGIVQDARGTPMEGAEVRLDAGRRSGVAARTTHTDARGAFAFRELVPGQVHVRARREGVQGWTEKVETLLPKRSVWTTLVLADTGMVQGRVTQASGKPPSEPALVRAVARTSTGGGAANISYAETDAQGVYSMELPAGVYQLTAVLPRARFIYFQDDDPSVTVHAGSAVQQDLVLLEERGISGTVREPSGAPSPFAIVAAVQGGDMPFILRVQANEEGTFEVPTRPQGAPPLAELAAYNAGRTVRVPSVSEGQGLVELRLKPAARLRGKLVAKGGTPPDGFTLTLTEASGEELPWEAEAPSTRHFTGDTFELLDAPGQALKVHVRARDGRTGSAQVALTPGGASEVEVELEGTGAAGIAGRAVWARNGGPAAGVAVFLDQPVSAKPDTHTGPDGRFQLPDVRPGPHTVRLMPFEGRVETRAVKVKPGETTDVGDVTVSPRRAQPGTVGAGFSEARGSVEVAWLTPDGPAARAGVVVGDRLVSVDGLVVRDRAEAEARTRGTPGSPVRLQVRREGQERELFATRAE
ncbi:carboxypeptidase regulatory-like domain-containing protein [Myxococcus faecalis]|uniref:carboxypeptidase regulatory-like domain-containing protein n=1 Tax=Myxococcus faecalis TaxID=3115646 RepID=UPI0038D1EEC8